MVIYLNSETAFQEPLCIRDGLCQNRILVFRVGMHDPRQRTPFRVAA